MTVTAKTKVINTALGHLGEPGFEDIEVSPTPPKLVKVFQQIDLALDWVLRRHGWLCAQTYLEMDPSTQAGNWKYPYVYELPADYVRMWEVNTSGAHEVGSMMISGAAKRVLLHTSPGPVYISYIARKDWEAYDPDLLNVLAYVLAARCAGPIQDDDAKANRLQQKAEQMLGMAMSSEHGEQGDQDPVFTSPYQALRRSAG